LGHASAPFRVFCSEQTANRPRAVKPPEDKSEDESVAYHTQSYDCVKDEVEVANYVLNQTSE